MDAIQSQAIKTEVISNGEVTLPELKKDGSVVLDPKEEKAPVETKPEEPKEESKEAPKEETPENKEQERLSPRFAALAKREKAIQREQQAAKAREAQLLERETLIKQKEDWVTNAKMDPLKALEALGLTYQEVTDFILNGNKPSPENEIQAVRKEINAWKKQQEDAAKKAQEEAQLRAKAEVEEKISKFKEGLNEFIGKNPEKYELIHLNDASDLVYDTIERHWNDTGKILKMDEACDMVEDFFDKDQVEKLLKAKKIQAKLNPVVKKDDTKEVKKTVTLSNDLSGAGMPNAMSAKTEQERIQRALAALGS